ncbi:MAG: sigma-70 family RNA polymerase sigma factor [Deltaproteobacteria bacterium]|nr:MAG: sigma-70 family RNA polymerase sigma factor [Deltaproteobacteria bacterium]
MHVAVPGAYSSLQCATKPRFHSGTAVSLAWARGLLVAMPTANANARILPESPAESSVTQSLRLPKVVGEVVKGLKDPERFSAWLFTIARNRARSYLTSRATHVRAVEEAMRESRLAEDSVPEVSAQLEREAELRAVREVIDNLREGPEKETVRLFYLDGTLSAREIADRMGVGKSAVTMRLERFRARVRRELCEKLQRTA